VRMTPFSEHYASARPRAFGFDFKLCALSLLACAVAGLGLPAVLQREISLRQYRTSARPACENMISATSCGPSSLLRLRGGALGIDDDGDSLMGRQPSPAIGTTLTLADTESFPVANASILQEITWCEGEGIPFSFVARKLQRAENCSAGGDAAGVDVALSELLLCALAGSPADLASLVCLLCDQISSPALAGTRIVPSPILLNAMAEAFGHSLERVRDEVAAAHRARCTLSEPDCTCLRACIDAPSVAERLRRAQRVLFPSPRLRVASLLDSMHKAAALHGKNATQAARMLLVAAGSGAEARFLTAALCGRLRYAYCGVKPIVSALARALVALPRLRGALCAAGAPPASLRALPAPAAGKTPPRPRTNRTSLVPPLVLIGHATSLDR